MKWTSKHPLACCTWILAAWLAVGAAHAACPSVPTAQRFIYSADGSEVTDKRTGLTWARCSVGQSWTGTTCTGRVISMNHEAALKYARNLAGWRLPNVKELSSLVDRGCRKPSIDAAAFPNTVSVSYWTSSPYARDSEDVWHVDFNSGDLSYSPISRRDSLIHYWVRLVRTSP